MKFDLKRKIQEWKRVLSITKKPSRDEFSASAKITGIGILLIGMVGFLIYLFGKITNIF
ncbi:MAG: protein translocase SEC61 complex subunit gamma [Candidatus Aenigmarchaeota archaeon]|nr:protein translocase SEC61 complex subunit gamma [Candidatus Aenigmarchaeota archaeon]MCK5372864.1 protein translocase SEC61 complex subunit gamma [Candidatus Aenigmarchaeota archaeon]